VVATLLALGPPFADDLRERLTVGEDAAQGGPRNNHPHRLLTNSTPAPDTEGIDRDAPMPGGNGERSMTIELVEVRISGRRRAIESLLKDINRTIATQRQEPSVDQLVMLRGVLNPTWSEHGAAVRFEHGKARSVAERLVATARAQGLEASASGPAPGPARAPMTLQGAFEKVLELARSYNEDLASGLEEGIYEDGEPAANERAIAAVEEYLERGAQNKVYIELNRGLVGKVWADNPALLGDTAVIDTDLEGADEAELSVVATESGQYEAVVTHVDVEPNPIGEVSDKPAPGHEPTP